MALTFLAKKPATRGKTTLKQKEESEEEKEEAPEEEKKSIVAKKRFVFAPPARLISQEAIICFAISQSFEETETGRGKYENRFAIYSPHFRTKKTKAMEPRKHPLDKGQGREELSEKL